MLSFQGSSSSFVFSHAIWSRLCTNVLVINLQPCSARLSKVSRLPKPCCSPQELLYSVLLGIRLAFNCNYIFVVSGSLKWREALLVVFCASFCCGFNYQCWVVSLESATSNLSFIFCYFWHVSVSVTALRTMRAATEWQRGIKQGISTLLYFGIEKFQS